MKLKEKAKNMEPILRIGKNGITENVINEIKKVFEKRELIKIKFLKSALQKKNKKEAAKELAQKTGSEMIDAVGFVVVLYKKIKKIARRGTEW